MKKISILHWTASSFNLNSMGGLEVIEYNLLKKLQKDFDVKLFVPKLVGNEQNIYEIRHLDYLMKYDLFYYLNFIIRNKNTDYLIGSNSPLLAIFKPKKTVVMFHNYIRFLNSDIFLPFYSIFKKRYHKSHLIFCSKFLKEEFIKQYPLFPINNTHVIFNAVDEKNIKIRDEHYKKIKKVVFMGQWNYNKGFDLLVEAVKKLRIIRADFELYLIGGKNLWNDMKKNKDNITFEDQDYIKNVGLLKRDKLLKYISDKDILVVPSRWKEPFGIVAIEGLASGMVVITSGQGGLGDIIKNKYNGFIFKNNDLDNLVNKLDQVMDLKEEEVNRIRKNGYYSIKEKFTWDIYIGKLKNILQKLD